MRKSIFHCVLLCFFNLQIFAQCVSPIITPGGSTTFCIGGSVTLNTVLNATNKAIQFDGINDYVGIPTGAGLNALTNQVTIELWFNRTNSGSAVEFLTSKDIEKLEVHIGGIGTNAIRFIPTTGVYFDSPANVFTPGVWTHVACVYNASTLSGKIYINGVDVGAIKNGANPASTPLSISGSNGVILGNRQGGSLPYKGLIDEVRIWNIARTQSQIQSSMNQPVASNASGLITYCRLDEGTGLTTANAVSGTTAASVANGAAWQTVTNAQFFNGNYIWSTGATASSISVNTTGNYTITLSNVSGCSTSSSSLPVIVNSLPSPVITPSGTTTFCAGGSVVLTTGNYSSYLWSNAATTQSISVTTAGNFSVTVTDANGCTGNSLTTSTVIAPLPTGTLSSSAATVCSGNKPSLIFSAATGIGPFSLIINGTTYNNVSSGVSFSVVNPITTNSTYTLTRITDNGSVSACTSTVNSSVNITVVPLPSPTLSPVKPVCANSTGNVYTTQAGKTNYQWSVTGGTITAGGGTTNNTATVTWGASGPGHVKVNYQENGCSAATPTDISIPIYPVSPILVTTGPGTAVINSTGSYPFLFGDSITFSTSLGYSSYYWSNYSTSNSITIHTPGTYTLTVTDTLGCTAGSTSFTTTLITNNSKNKDYCYLPPDASYISLPSVDDDSYQIILPFSFQFFGNSYNTCYINTNGSITFNSGLAAYNYVPFPASVPIIAPFAADVDTRNGNTVKYKINQHSLIVTWPQVGYYNMHVDKVNTFQVILSDGTDPILEPGFNLCFRYGDIQWIRGDQNTTSDFPVFGYDAGDGVNYYNGVGSYSAQMLTVPDSNCYNFFTGLASTNINLPPILNEVPSNDTLLIPYGGIDSIMCNISAPEATQKIISSFDVGGLCNTNVTNTTGAIASAKIVITGNACNTGTHIVKLNVYDNSGINPASLTKQFVVIVNSQPSILTLNLKVFIQGYYAGGGMMQSVLQNAGSSSNPLICDSIQVELHAADDPNTIYAVSRAPLFTNGIATIQFPANLSSKSVYIVIRTKNTLETWSKYPVKLFTNTSFDFSAADSRTPDKSGLTSLTAARSCKDILTRFPASSNNLYWIDPDSTGSIAPMKCYCEMTKYGGGWTLVAQHTNGDVSLYNITYPIATNNAVTTSGTGMRGDQDIWMGLANWNIIGSELLIELDTAISSTNIIKATKYNFTIAPLNNFLLTLTNKIDLVGTSTGNGILANMSNTYFRTAETDDHGIKGPWWYANHILTPAPTEKFWGTNNLGGLLNFNTINYKWGGIWVR